jgi:hypothetical protein
MNAVMNPLSEAALRRLTNEATTTFLGEAEHYQAAARPAAGLVYAVDFPIMVRDDLPLVARPRTRRKRGSHASDRRLAPGPDGVSARDGEGDGSGSLRHAPRC